MTTPTTPAQRPTPPREISLLEGVCAHEYGHALIAAVVGIRTRNVRVGETLLGREAWGLSRSTTTKQPTPGNTP